MKPAHKSNAGQIVNEDKAVKVLSDYIKQAKASEEEFLKTPDVADIIAGELKVSRAFAYKLMQDALDEAKKGEPK